MRGDDMKRLRKGLNMERWQFAALLGYTGTHRNNATRIHRMEDNRQQIPLYIARLVWLLGNHLRRTGELPVFPNWPGYDFDHSPDSIAMGNDPQTGMR
jgi:hypothetical protein